MSKEISRRDFLKSAAIGTAAIASTSLVGCSPVAAPNDTPPAAPAPEITREPVIPGWMPEKWDYETEILICGYGGSGAISAIRAHDAGAKVLVIEKQQQDEEDGTYHQFNCTRLAASAMMSFKSEPEAIEYLTEVSMGRTPADVIASWAKYSTQTIDYINSLDINPNNNGDQSTEYPLDILPSGTNYNMYMCRNRGMEFWEGLEKARKDRGIEVMFETPARKLIQDYDGMIVGVIATQNGKDIAIRASKAVILSTGGFEYDFDMLNQYVFCSPTRFYANPANTGDGIKMAQAAGADLWHMSLVGGRVIPYFEELGYGIPGGTPAPYMLVNKYGKRFVRENWKSHSAVWEFNKFSTDTGDFQSAPCFSIFDQSAVDAGPVVSEYIGMLLVSGYEWSRDNSAEIEKGWIFKGETIEELAKKIAEDPDVTPRRMDPAVLADTLKTYNKYCAAGKDPEFNRSEITLKPLTQPPYYALKMYPGGVNTFGGPRRNDKSQIVRPDGTAIPHLYGTGEMGSVLGFLYSGGGWNICECVVSGMMSADNAINETHWGS